MELKQAFKKSGQSARLTERLASHGISFKFNKRLVRVSNTRWNGGRLIDGTCHYRNAFEVAGNTYPIKETLKALGFKWDGVEKVWYAHGSQIAGTTLEAKAAIVKTIEMR